MSKNIFAKTCIPNIAEALVQSFDDNNPVLLYQNACDILQHELKTVDDRGNRAIGTHIRQNILPGYACYRALTNAGISQKEAIAFVEEEMCKGLQRMGNICRKLSTKWYGYLVFKFVFSIGMKLGYPKEGWTVEQLEKSKERICFNISSCLYCEELETRGALELCLAFCQMDHATYDPLAPAVIFKRENTISKGGKQCDFCFERSNIRSS